MNRAFWGLDRTDQRQLPLDNRYTYNATGHWVTANHIKPAVANMSLGAPASQALDDAVKNSIAA